MEKADSSLNDEIKKRAETKNYFDQNEIYHIFGGIVRTLVAMHADNIVHRDIKP